MSAGITAGARRGLRIAHLFPELLNLYGDSGNMLVLKRRLAWRGLGCDVVEVSLGESLSFSDVDIVFMGGGTDREQRIVCERLLSWRGEIASYVADGGVLVAVCGGYQLLGHYYQLGGEKVRGLGLVDLYTDRAEPRLIGNVAVRSRVSPQPIVGYENHGGRTHLGPGVEPLGTVAYGFGNDGSSGQEGCLSNNVLGTYVHGPLLPKNPGVADYLLSRALERKYGQGSLEPLDDGEELAANKVMYDRMMAGAVPVR
ncbi:type 1 glutamine amidotransferase [Olsenella sp. HMSC062G07]|uniref:type 1 glutamine amidotransferase n=1 Tax=Olsenella sp. HMSC062G07 TaxID=1739330 RepID=UPI0008A4AAC3|nr:glutamine amidotransferase [Olsenella sp. HMSC062G07]OFK24787.1 glutamine amidotransferase [Olsenella sp. HMSC062G07]